jgi:ABC-2 type transport system permease protein
VNELGIVFVAELLRRLRSRIFWLASVAGVVAIAFIIEAPLFFESLAHSSSSYIVLAGPPALRAGAKPLLERKGAYRIVASVDTLPAHVTVDYLTKHGDAGAAIALSERAGRLRLDVYPRDLSAFDDVEFRSLAPLGVELGTGLAPARVERAATIEHVVHPLDAKFKDTRSATLAHAVAFTLIFMLYLAIILGSQSVMSAVAEEKTSRIAEILIATIDPVHLLYGKTLAATAIALLQIGLWIATGAALLPNAAAQLAAAGSGNASGSAAATPEASALLSVDPGLLVAFLAFFVLGYLQYAAIYAAAASLVSRTEELGSVTTPIILPVLGAFFVAQYALVTPDAPVVIVCSFVPFLSPFVAFTRLAITEVPVWQVVLEIAVNVVTVVSCFWAAGKIYRVGMLLYGKLPSPRQVFAALRS